MSDQRVIIARASSTTGAEDYRVDIQTGGHALIADEPVSLHGQDAGPPPYGLLLASLAACTSITLRMYAQRKQWPLDGVELDLRYTTSGEDARIERRITLLGDLAPDQRERLAQVAERTPVTLTLKSGVAIDTDVRERR